MRHIQRPVVCCLVSWENIVNLWEYGLLHVDPDGEIQIEKTKVQQIVELKQMGVSPVMDSTVSFLSHIDF
jgi:hypothetical protein